MLVDADADAGPGCLEFLRIDFGGTCAPVAVFFSVDADAVEDALAVLVLLVFGPFPVEPPLDLTSSIRGSLLDNTAFCWAAEFASRSAVGTNTVRVSSLPLEAMLGVPICRERRMCAFSSTCSSASSGYDNIQQ